MGEDVGRYGGCFGVSRGLLEEFGPERIRDTPLSESAFVGAGIGAALGGMRPIVEVMTVNFSLLALDQIVNNAATLPHMSGGQFHVPLVIRMTTGAGRQLAAQHSHSLEGWYAHVPGLRVVAPATLEDARGDARPGARRPRPGDHLRARRAVQPRGRAAPTTPAPVDIDRAAVRRPGTDVSLIAYGGTLGKALAAAEQLAERRHRRRGPRPARAPPARRADASSTSVARTHRAVVVDEGWRTGSLAAEIAARDHRGGLLRARRAGRAGVHRRGADAVRKHLEDAALPQPAAIVAAAARARWADVGEFRMPSLGADMDVGTVLEWQVAPGDAVHRGDIVATSTPTRPTSTSRSSRTASSRSCWSSRRRGRRRHGAGPHRGPAPASLARQRPSRPRAVPADSAADPPRRPHAVADAGDGRRPQRTPDRPRAVVAARPARAELGASTSPSCTGTGPDGAVVATRRRRAAGAPAAPQRAAGRHPSARPPTDAGRASRDAPRDRRADGALQARDPALLRGDHHRPRPPRWPGSRERNAGRPVTERLLPAALLLKATALAARAGPRAERLLGRRASGPPTRSTSAWRSRCAAAASSPRRSTTPTGCRRRAHGAPCATSSRRARAGGLRARRWPTRTITVTNLGDQGADGPRRDLPAAGRARRLRRVVERPWADDGMLGVRPTVTATLAADHRVSDGHGGARFLAMLDRLLQAPEEL